MKKVLFTVTAAVLTLAVLFSSVSCGIPKLLNTLASDTDTDEATEAAATVPATTEAAPETAIETVTEAATEAPTEASAEAVTAAPVPTDEEIYETYKNAVDKTNALSELSFKNYSDIAMTVNFVGTSLDMRSVKDQAISVTGRGSGNLTFESHTNKTVESNGKSSGAVEEIFIDEHNIYFRTDTSSEYSVVSRLSADPAVLNEYLSDKNTGISELPPEIFAKATMITGANGKTYIIAHPSNSVADSVYNDVAEQMKTALEAMDAEILSLSTNSSEMSFVISPDGYLVSEEISVDMLMLIKYSGVTGAAEINGKTKMNVTDPGEKVVITLPEITVVPVTGDDRIYEEYKNAVDKVNGCNDIYSEILMVQSMVMTFGETKSTNVVTNKSSVLCHDRYGSGTVIEAHILQQEDSDGETETTQYDIFADKNNVYIRMDPDSAYIVLSRDSAQAQAFNDSTDPESTKSDALDPEALRGAVISENVDGSKTITSSPDDNAINAVFYGYAETMTESFSNMGAENITHDITGAEILIILNSEGYVESETATMTIDFYLTLYGANVKVSINASMTRTNIDPGQEVTITVPEN